MQGKLLSGICAAALSIAIGGATMGVAQAQQLQDSAIAGLVGLGYDTSKLGTLTADQAAQIENVLGSSDAPETKTARVDAILGHPGDAQVPDAGGVAQLDDSVTASLVALGVDTANVSLLSADGLAKLENIVNSGAAPGDKKAQAEQILASVDGSAGGVWADQQLSDSVTADMVKIGLDPTLVESASLDQLSQIELIMSSSDTDQVKRGRVEAVLAQ